VSLAASILRHLARLGVGAPIQLYNQPLLGTAEIDNILTHGVLSAESEALHPQTAQQAPGDFFRLGFVPAEFACPGDLPYAAGE
jgi:hypothetical protein